MFGIVDGTGVAYLQPRENSDIQVIIERVFYLVAADIVQRCEMEHIAAHQERLVTLHICSGGVKQTGCPVHDLGLGFARHEQT